MRRVRPWVKKALLVSIIIVAVGAGFRLVSGEHGRDFKQVVRVSQEAHARPAGDMKFSIKGGESAAVPVPDMPALRGGDGPMKVQIGGQGGIRRMEGHREHGVGAGFVIGGLILIAGLFFLLRRGKRSRRVEGPNALVGIPSASDFLDQWELQQNQSKESK